MTRGYLFVRNKINTCYRKTARQLFHMYISLLGKQCVVAKIEHPSLANYLYGIIGIAWLCDKADVTLQYIFPKENPSFLKNATLYQSFPNKICSGNSFLSAISTIA